MAKANYIKLDDAAEKLGISVEKLKAMIDNNEVRAFRDGASFKFKREEVDRIQATLGDTHDAAGDGIQLVDDSLDELVSVDGILDDDDSADSLLVEERGSGNATVIGESGGDAAADSDLKLASTSDVTLGDDEPALAGDSDVLGGDPAMTLTGSDTGVLGTESSDIELKLDDESLELSMSDAEGSDLKLSADDDDGSIDLDDGDLAIGSGVGSDVTLGGGDSGINLSNPSDSGLSLEDAGIDLSADDSLDLGDDDMLSLDGDDFDADADEFKADDDFLLTPVEDEAGEDDSDSGSQVIALDSEEFDDSAATILDGDADGGFGDALVEEVDGGFGSAVVGAAPVAASALAPATAEEADFSIWNILSLACLLVLMCLAGVMMLDVMKNIWSWDGSGAFSSAIMDPLAGLLK